MTKNAENMNLKQYEIEHYKRDFSYGSDITLGLDPLPPMSHFVTFDLDPPTPHVTAQIVTNSDNNSSYKFE